MRIARIIDDFFFARISASGFGLMRIAWAGTVLAFLGMQWSDLARYYSDAGFLPRSLGYLVFRSQWRFTIFDYVSTPHGVELVAFALLCSATLMLLGILPRLFTILSFILLCGFHERNLLPLSGGDTVLRLVGFLLCIAPELRAFSLTRLRMQWLSWKKHTRILAPLTMSIWPYRLLLWQVMIVYYFSLLDKLKGEMWLTGTATASVLHHPHFARWPMWVSDWMSTASVPLSYGTILFEALWLLLLFPRPLVLPLLPTRLHGISLKRWLLLAGVAFHGGIFLFLDVGSFSIAMMVAYLGLLLNSDFAAFKRMCGSARAQVALLYDGKCGLCIRSVFGILMLDPVGRVRPVDFHDKAARTAVAPELKFADLDKAMHIKTGTGRSEKGFDAFRLLAWSLPPLWPLAPLLYIPGIPPVGRIIYAQISKRRRRCDHVQCV